MNILKNRALIYKGLALCTLSWFGMGLCKAQDTTYLDAVYKHVKSPGKATFYMILEGHKNARSSAEKDQVVERIYFKNGQIASEKHYSSYSEGITDGKTKKWYENGQLKQYVNYSKGAPINDLLTYWKNGKIRRQDKYDDKGKLISGICYDSNGNKRPYFAFIKAPVFTYYKGEVPNYFHDKIKYPKSSNLSGVGGSITVTYTVETDGTVSNINITESTGDRDLDSAVLDVFTGIPLWEPGTEDGEPVRVTQSLSLKFDPGGW